MKIKLCLVLTLLSQVIFAQPRAISLRELSSNRGVSLKYGWLRKAGDDLRWRYESYKDTTGWERASQNSDEFVNEDIVWIQKVKIGWFKRPLKIDKSLVNRLLYLDVVQFGASEIYLDSVLLGKVGTVSAAPDREQTKIHGHFITFSLPDTNVHTLSVRFSCAQYGLLVNSPSRKLFTLRIYDTENQRDQLHNGTDINDLFYAFAGGIFLLFSLLHFSFFATNPKQRSGLFLGITTFFFASAILINSVFLFEDNLFDFQVFELLQFLFISGGVLGLLTSLYVHLAYRFSWTYWLCALCFLIAVGAVVQGYSFPLFLEWWAPFILAFIEFLRVSIVASNKDRPNAKLPLYSLIVSVVAMILLSVIAPLLSNYYGYTQELFTFGIAVIVVLAFVMVFAVPIGMSLSLVAEYSLATRSLQHKIAEIEQLSVEKQQILADQNQLLEQQVEARTAELRASQSQLIQSEKLASLGELTAGIAHEIQNPLNFVNNFSELSVELLDELKSPLTPDGEIKEGERVDMELLGDIVQNLEKINLHGKRASSIVKGMLEHSRASTGERQPTDINQLADEYLRLSYHGMRAKDKQFNADYELVADESLPQINIVPQDIGRVLLNLMNNAFYAVRTVESPKVTVTTLQGDKQLIIKVKDNGTGMNEEVKTKIFQPFFTTKPTGEGTGLGLSLSYDIITKGHGGTIEVESVEGEGTTFVVRLPTV